MATASEGWGAGQAAPIDGGLGKILSRVLTNPIAAKMKNPTNIFAVATREGNNLWLVLRVRYAPSGFYVLVPHPIRTWDAHLSYHTNGRLHIKTHGMQPVPQRMLQPITDKFSGSVHLGKFAVGHVGVVCEPAKFRRVIEVPIERLRGKGSFVAVDIAAPGAQPTSSEKILGDIVQENRITETNPNIVIRIGTQRSLPGPPATRRHHMLVDRSFMTGATVVLILAVAFVLIVLLWPLGRLPWP